MNMLFSTVFRIAVNSWTPLARSDDWVFQPPCASSPVLDTTAAAIGAAHGVTGPQVSVQLLKLWGCRPSSLAWRIVFISTRCWFVLACPQLVWQMTIFLHHFAMLLIV